MSEEVVARRNLSPSVRIAASSTSTAETRPSTDRMEQATGGLNQGGAALEKSEAVWGSSRDHDGKLTHGDGQCRAQSGTVSVKLNQGRTA
ncbi:hypothetical protein D1007_03950 [Hordeum vulgare]|nr:hypothetical protein D1007_03950 [Hordeum vulgare]